MDIPNPGPELSRTTAGALVRTRILIASVPAAGHVNPLLPLARALSARGHELAWYAGAEYRTKVEATGARFIGYTHARDFDYSDMAGAFPQRAKLRGLRALKFDMKHVFIDQSPGQLRDLQQITRDFAPQLVLAEPGVIGALFHHELGGPPSALLCVLPLVLSSIDAAPFGLALLPSATALGRVRNRALNLLVERVLFRDVQRHWTRVRRSVGLGPTEWWLNSVTRADLCMQPSVPGFEYPRSDLPRAVQFIGMMPADAPSDCIAPDYFRELDGERPVVPITQGTLANETPQLIRPALEGLAGEPVLVVVTTGGRPIEQLGLGPLPANARISTYLSYPELLPKTAVMVTNGGYGGVQTALAYGVPLVVAGATEDKPEVAMRVAWSGVGINLKTATPTPDQVRNAVRAVLDDPRYRERARALAAEYARYHAVQRAVQLVEDLIDRNSPERAGKTPAAPPGIEAAT